LDKDFGISRDEIMAKLKEALIDTRPFFHVLSDYPMFEKVSTPVARYIADNGINLPSGVLLTEEEVDYVCNEFKKILGH
jgi:perosamine synthetase